MEGGGCGGMEEGGREGGAESAQTVRRLQRLRGREILATTEQRDHAGGAGESEWESERVVCGVRSLARYQGPLTPDYRGDRK